MLILRTGNKPLREHRFSDYGRVYMYAAQFWPAPGDHG